MRSFHISETTQKMCFRYCHVGTLEGFPVGSLVKNPLAKQEMQVQFLGQEDPLEKGMATHYRILGWRIPWTEGPGGLPSMRSQRVRRDLVTEQQQQGTSERS